MPTTPNDGETHEPADKQRQCARLGNNRRGHTATCRAGSAHARHTRLLILGVATAGSRSDGNGGKKLTAGGCNCQEILAVPEGDGIHKCAVVADCGYSRRTACGVGSCDRWVEDIIRKPKTWHRERYRARYRGRRRSSLKKCLSLPTSR